MKVGSAWAVNSNESSNYNWILIEAVLRVFQSFSDDLTLFYVFIKQLQALLTGWDHFCLQHTQSSKIKPVCTMSTQKFDLQPRWAFFLL